METHFLEDVPTSLWYNDVKAGGHFWWTRTFSVSISCDMKFKMFPFDEHNCSLELIGGNVIQFTKFGDSKAFAKTKDTEDGKFNVELKGTKISDWHLNPEFTTSLYPEVSLKLSLRRKLADFWRLFSEFYFPTFAFSKLSLFAFSIPTESVRIRYILLLIFYCTHCIPILRYLGV